ncbi:MAG: adenine phosphoribosyltransferase [Clostridiales bacterium]|jgi:adenine phosphoribosyltransferase|nr:adenine phosphoribosyltransferase [Clostridiales bacterium]HOB64536.1 phosphoribosyltransferase family protein [Clostridia bacterium]HOK82011.1 phosphoribosyltransferase family protein [Clostridia bacterium]HOL61446.1 phosphoribosyltransferase family protein [Clostridia bacterium]HPO53694.1 phosphoribosyltransferase family protein [Clostridia bacterium]
MDKYPLEIKGYKVELPILPIDNGIKICFFNLHGAQELTEHCAKHIAELVKGCDIVITAESKGLQLAHCVARNLGQKFYAVARKSLKLYMQDGISVTVKSITTKNVQTLYLSAHDAGLLKGKKVAVVDDVISTGGSLLGLEALIAKAGGEVFAKAFVLAEGDAAKREDVKFLATIPLL